MSKSLCKSRDGRLARDNVANPPHPMRHDSEGRNNGKFFSRNNARSQLPRRERLAYRFETRNHFVHCGALSWILGGHVRYQRLDKLKPEVPLPARMRGWKSAKDMTREQERVYLDKLGPYKISDEIHIGGEWVTR